MVLVSQGMPSGSLSPGTMDRLKLTRFAVIGLWICGLLRIMIDNPFNGIATLFSAICGTYTFMNDTRFLKCYEFMAGNCIICGSGGASCLGPFMSISMINAVFDIFRFFSLVSGGGLLVFPLASLAILSSIILQIHVFISCLSVYKELVQPFDTPLPISRPLNEDRNYVSLSGETRQGFVPFGGEGRRLA